MKEALQNLKRLEKLQTCPPAILILCPDFTRRERLLGKLLKRWNLNSAPCLWDGSQLQGKELDKLFGALNNLSLFGASSPHLIRRTEDLSAGHQKKLLKFLEDSKGHEPLFLSGSKLPAKNPLKKYFQHQKCLLELSPLKGEELFDWVRREAAAGGISELSKSAITSLVFISNESVDLLATRIRQLSLFADGEKVTERMLFKLFVSEPDPNEYTIIDDVAAGRLAEAELTVGEILRQGKSPFLLLHMLSRTYGHYFAIRSMLSAGKQPREVQTALGLKPWLFEKSLAGAKKFSLTRLGEALESILRADSTLKNKSLGPEAVFSNLLFDLKP